MFRDHFNTLVQWESGSHRKPLIVRGARQTGKTYLIREFGNKRFDNIVEVNVDSRPEVRTVFESRDVDQIVRLLELDSGSRIIPGKTLLFFDEVQAAPEIIPTLRYFFEEMPKLHVIAAGSLLDFTLAEHSFSMPVGRVEYLYLGPMTFYEFLRASGDGDYIDYLGSYSISKPFSPLVHENLLKRLRDFCVVGGMPAAVKAYLSEKNYEESFREQQAILQSISDDFAKYPARTNPALLRSILRKSPANVGRRIKYVNLDRDHQSKTITRCLDFLELARIIYRVRHSAANGIPLAAETKDRDFKMLFLDVGLVCGALGVATSLLQRVNDLTLVNSGAIAEQFVGQHLLYASPSYQLPELFYWNRESKGSSAEIDYVINAGSRVVPVEVKAGKTGRLRSLATFAAEKKSAIAVRFNSESPSIAPMNAPTSLGIPLTCNLLSLPLTMVGEIQRLAGERITS